MALDKDLAKQLARVVARLERDRLERDRLIAQLVIKGGSLRAIGDVARLSHVGVKKVVERTGSGEP